MRSTTGRDSRTRALSEKPCANAAGESTASVTTGSKRLFIVAPESSWCLPSCNARTPVPDDRRGDTREGCRRGATLFLGGCLGRRGGRRIEGEGERLGVRDLDLVADFR